MEPEVTHTIELPLSDDGGVLVLLLTISGSALRDTVSDLATFSFSCEERRQISKKYVRVPSQTFAKYRHHVAHILAKSFGRLYIRAIFSKVDVFTVLECTSCIERHQ